jgi:hypothetical protein
VSQVSGFEIVEVRPFLSGQPGCAYFDRDGLVYSTRFHPGGTGRSHWNAAIANGAELVAGIGDRALWIEDVWNLWVEHGETIVMTSVGRIGDTPTRFDLAKKLATAFFP